MNWLERIVLLLDRCLGGLLFAAAAFCVVWGGWLGFQGDAAYMAAFELAAVALLPAAGFGIAALALRRRWRWRWAAQGLPLLGIVSVLGLPGFPRTDRFFLEQAALEKPQLFREMAQPQYFKEHEQRGLGVAGHRIVEGEGLVLAYRWYSPGFVFLIDDERYRKLTVWFPSGLEGRSGAVRLGSGDVVAVYSEGASAWPHRYCYGYLESGTIRYARRGDDHIDADIDASAVLLWPFPGGRGYCAGERETAERYPFKKLSGSRLTPWLGRPRPGDHVYRETYR